MTPSDNMPSFICNKCMIGIELSLTLRSRALKSYEEMQQTLKEIENTDITFFDENDMSESSDIENDEATNDDDQDAVSFLLKNIKDDQEDNLIIPMSSTEPEPKQLSLSLPIIVMEAEMKANNTKVPKKPIQTEIEPEGSYSSRKFACNACDKRFLKRSNLIDHLKIHANLKSFQCDFCSKSFIQYGNLKAHLRSHTKEKPFK